MHVRHRINLFTWPCGGTGKTHSAQNGTPLMAYGFDSLQGYNDCFLYFFNGNLMTVNKTPFSINSLFFGEKNTCILTLKEKDGERIVLMIIGYLDAQPIAIELEKISKPRPWMHDLMRTILIEHDIEVNVLLYNNIYFW